MWIRKGIRLLADELGTGSPVKRQQNYLMAIRLTLNHGDAVRHPEKCLSHTIDENLKTEDDGYFQHRARVDREHLIIGIFYAVQGMAVGGYRKVAIAPHLAYGEAGLPNIIPSNAKLIAEIKVLEEI